MVIAEAHFAVMPGRLATDCLKAGCPRDGIALDPFAGTGTTCRCAAAMGMGSVGIELNPEYAAIAARRIAEAHETWNGGPLLKDME